MIKEMNIGTLNTALKQKEKLEMKNLNNWGCESYLYKKRKLEKYNHG